MELRLLGSLDINTGNGQIVVPAGKPRSLLVLLALHPNEPVASDQIVDALWGETPPASATAIVQTYVSRLRKILGDGRIETVGHGYRLALENGERDIDRVDALRARAATEPPPRAAESLREAIALFRGQPLADVAREEFAQAELRRLEELRATLVVDRLEAEVAAGRHAEVLAELEGLVAARPLDERLRGLLILALYRTGRQAEALAAYQDARRTLKDDLGLEPSEELRSLQRKILEHDPSLGAPEPAPSGVVPSARSFLRRRMSVVAVVAGAVLVLAAAGVASALVLRERGPTTIAVVPNSVAVVDPKTLEVVASIPVGQRPVLVAATPASVWVASTGDRVLTRIDPGTFEVLGTVGLGFEPTAVEAVGDAVWVAGGYDHALWRVDRDGLARVKLTFDERYPGPEGFERGPAGLASSKHGLWLAHGREVTLLDPVTGRARESARIGGPWTTAIDVGRRGLVGSQLGLETFDPRTLKPGPRVSPLFDPPPPNLPDWATVGGGGLVSDLVLLSAPSHPGGAPGQEIWIAWRWGQVWQLWERILSLIRSVDVDEQVAALTWLDGRLWAVSQRGVERLPSRQLRPVVWRIDPADGRIDATVELAHTLEDAAAANGLLWVAVRAP
jgi:YVTN family beta-propeller protein